jgi:hypothetical protein
VARVLRSIPRFAGNPAAIRPDMDLITTSLNRDHITIRKFFQ